MNASTFFSRSTGPQSTSSSSSSANRSTGPRANSTGTGGPGSGVNSSSSSTRTTSPTPGASTNTSSTNGFNFHFEFPSFNLSNLTDSFTSARLSPPNLSTLISKQRSSSSTRNESPSPSTSSGPNNSPGARLIMVCENCGTKFHFLKRKKTCSDCSMDYCANCFPKDNNHDFFPLMRRARCRRCRIFNMQPLDRNALFELRIKDLKWYMEKKRIPHRFCKEKCELVDLILRSSDSYSRRMYTPPNSYPTSPFNSRTSSSTTSSSDHPNRVPRQETDDSWVFVDTDEPVNRSAAVDINSPSQDNSSGASNPSNSNSNNNTNSSSTNTSVNNNSFTSTDNTTTTTSSSTTNNMSSNLSSNIVNGNVFDSSSTTNAATSSSSTDHQNEETTTSKENINFDNNSSSSLNTDFKPFNISDLTSEDQIRDLSIRQIKLLLTRNFVDFKGCCEKEELLEKAIRLWRDVNKARERGSEELDDDNACKICMEKMIDCVLLECGHVVTCIDCGKRMNECPICRQYVVRAVRIFKS